MNGTRTTVGVIGLLLALILVGGGVLVWMAPVPAEDMTSAREILPNIVDWDDQGFGGSDSGVRRFTPRAEENQRRRNLVN